MAFTAGGVAVTSDQTAEIGASLGLPAVASAAAGAASGLSAHAGNTSNPHVTTKAQVGLGNVDNTSDVNKPVSTPQAAAIAAIDPSLAISSITYNGSSQITGYTQNGQAYVITYGTVGVGGASVPVTKAGNGKTTTYHYTSGLLTSTTVV